MIPFHTQTAKANTCPCACPSLLRREQIIGRAPPAGARPPAACWLWGGWVGAGGNGERGRTRHIAVAVVSVGGPRGVAGGVGPPGASGVVGPVGAPAGAPLDRPPLSPPPSL